MKACAKCGEVKPVDAFRCKGSNTQCRRCDYRLRVRDTKKEWERQQRWREKNPDRHKEQKGASQAKSIAEMSDAYIAGLIQVPVDECTPELIQRKREQLEMHRLIRQLKRESKNGLNVSGN